MKKQLKSEIRTRLIEEAEAEQLEGDMNGRPTYALKSAIERIKLYEYGLNDELPPEWRRYKNK